MFEGSDLSLAYGSYDQQAPLQQQQAVPPLQQPQKQQLPSQQPARLQQPNDAPYQPPEAMYAQQQQQYKFKEEGFFDRFFDRRYDVLKVISFALIIVLAISFDRVFTFYITQYVAEAVLTTSQEMLVRMSYPITILLVIWLIKAV